MDINLLKRMGVIESSAEDVTVGVFDHPSVTLTPGPVSQPSLPGSLTELNIGRGLKAPVFYTDPDDGSRLFGRDVPVGYNIDPSPFVLANMTKFEIALNRVHVMMHLYPDIIKAGSPVNIRDYKRLAKEYQIQTCYLKDGQYWSGKSVDTNIKG